MSSQYQKAIEAGYSPEEVHVFLEKKHPGFNKAMEAGYSPEEILDFFASKKQPKESRLANAGRQLGRTGARVAETVLGAPRALGEFGEMLVPEKLLKKGAEKIGLKEPVEKGIEFAKEHAPYKLFPKSEQIRDINKQLFGKKIEPKNEWEAKADELVSDFAALSIPLPGSQFKLLKPALLALGGNLAKEGIAQVGGTEKQQTYAKLGTILAGSMINPQAAKKLSSSLYEKARNARPLDAKINASKLYDASEKFEKQLLKGDPNAGSKKKSLDLIKDIQKKIKNDEIDIEELEQFKRDINEARSGLYENFKTDKVGRKSAKRNLDEVSKFIDNSLREYGKINPQWESFYRPANEVHGAIAQSHKARNFIGYWSKKLGMHYLLPLIGFGHGGVAGLGSTLGVGAIGGAGLLGAELGAQLFKSPTLRKHYTNLINSALKEDAIAVKENLKKINKEVKKEDQSNKENKAPKPIRKT
jgi:hypothetical protein